MLKINKQILLVLLCAVNTLMAQPIFKTYENAPIQLKETVLENGMKVILVETHDKTEIIGSFIVNVGSKNDPANNTGMAHYLEHMLFKGTKELGTTDYAKEEIHLKRINALYDELGKETNRKKRLLISEQINQESKLAAQYAIPNEFQRIVAEMGGTRLNAFTSNDMTVYLNKFPPNQLEKWLALYVHRFTDPVFRSFQTELETVYEEKNRKLDNRMNHMMDEFFKLGFKGHPYGSQTTLGKTEHLKNPSLSAMYDYFKTYYVPSNMALILVGDFDSEAVFPVIKEKLLQLPNRKLTKTDDFHIDPIEGRVEKTIKSSVIKMAVYGYRVPGLKNVHKAKLDLLMALLSNDSETGLLDELSNSDQVMAAMGMGLNFIDHGLITLISVPKLIGQSFEEAEVLIMTELEKLKKGDFSEESLVALKKELIKNKKRELESNEKILFECFNYYLTDGDWSKITNYTNELESITKTDIIEYANDVFGEDFVVLFSKRGAEKQKQLKQPGYEPLVNKNHTKSSFYQSLSEVQNAAPEISYVDFSSAVERGTLGNGANIIQVKNPKNNIFELTYRWDIGTFDDPRFFYLPTYLNSVGTALDSFSVFRKKFQELSATYFFEADERYFYLKIDGVDEHLGKTVELADEMIRQPALKEDKIDEIVDMIKSDAKFDRASSEALSKALNAYVLYGKNSSYLQRLPLDTIKTITAKDYLSLFEVAQEYPLSITYIGNDTRVEDRLNTVFNQPPTKKRETETYLNRAEVMPNSNNIYFVNNKKATQAQISFNFPLGRIPVNEHYKMQAFNAYFGRGMSSIVFQEVREFRALAYTAYAVCLPGKTENNNALFKGYMGCQNDKAIEAITLMCELISNMPEIPERVDFIKQALILKSVTAKPGFREIAGKIEKWEEMGYRKDPGALFENDYKNLTFEGILAFYEAHIKGKPFTISIVGNKKKIDFKELSKFGEIVELKKSDVMVN